MIFTKKKIITISVVFILVLITYLFVLIFFNNYNDKKFVNILRNVDTLILDNSFIKAEELLITAIENVNSPLDYKILLKRTYQLQNLIMLTEISEKAYQKYPKDEQILEIYIYSLLKSRNIDNAQNVINNLQKLVLSENLILETTIKSGVYTSDDNIFYQGLNENNISVFNKLYQITKNKNFLINSVLLNLENGNYQQAEIIVSDIDTETVENKQLLLLTKYENGKYKEVLDLLMVYDFGYSPEEIFLIRVDIGIKMELYEEVLINITEFIRFYPDYSVLPYINLIYLDTFLIIPILKDYIKLGIQYYPDNRALNLILIEHYILSKNETIAIDLVKKYLKYNIEDIEFEIILKQLNGTANPEKFINNIYELVNITSDNSKNSRYLAWSLFENRNFIKLEDFLLTKENNFDNSWNYFFKALLSVTKDDYSLSLKHFHSAFSLEGNWETLFNMGILSEYMNDYTKAIEFYQSSENMLMFIPENITTKSFIRTTLASMFFKMNDYDKASRELRNALDLDDSNLKAHLLLKKLESTNY